MRFHVFRGLTLCALLSGLAFLPNPLPLAQAQEQTPDASGEDPGPYDIPPGWRAVTIEIDPVQGTTAFIAPGDWVDVMSTRVVNERLVNSIIVENAQVLATDLVDPSGDPRSARHVFTLTLSPSNAQRIELAQKIGTLSLLLRTSDTGTLGDDVRHRFDVGPNHHWIGDFPIPPWMHQGADPDTIDQRGIGPESDAEIFDQPLPARGYMR